MDISQKHAMIDIGSNSIRLVIVGIDRDFFSKEMMNFKAVARLSNYIDEQERLSEQGISVLLSVLRRFQFIIERESDVQLVDAFATAAMRKAKNREAVFQQVREETGLSIRLLPGLQEAFYGYLAVINSTYVEDGITIDIGGGSTEVTMFRNRRLIHSHSFAFGAVTLYQSFYKNGAADAGDRLETYIKNNFSEVDWLSGNRLPIIGIGGTARNLARIDQIREHYPMVGLHQYTMPRERLNRLTNVLAKMSIEERETMDGLSKDRSDIILPAAAVINTLVKMNEGESFMLSSEGLREGVFYEWVLKQRRQVRIPYVLNESLRQLRRDFNLDSAHTAYVKKLAFQILMGIMDFIKGTTASEERIAWVLSHSADLAYLGEFINNESSSAQTFYLLTNMNINGISHHNRLAVALVASFKNRSRLADYAKPFQKLVTKDELKLYELLGAVLRLAHDFDRTKLHVVDRLSVKMTKKKLRIIAYYHGDAYFEAQAAQRHKKHLERALKASLAINFVEGAE
ncbi:Ppx/GppA family phosphatase [Sporolactobacillus inulinus]|uniref:Exopolyphosphatase n=2 Tax=Sporolactobacillus inulinus TaxID=2078 RepID=A0A4Y1ZDK3_9BACL|nr:Ppx/GppA family phosphatase [Sporolactobacillus inulinus]KLI03556.1 phosphatase [Sporolactobacillus inulinus CASD]GAY77182.1 exopolyphosphatase [Sporolactobacillus inulinus]GEB76989.1 exopolyphosphatase [Sporolactobacillus inulinus]